MKKFDYFEREPVEYIKRIKEATLFHYTSVEALKNILENREFWLTESKYLNDYQELRYTYDMILKEFMPQYEHKLFYGPLIQELRNSFEQESTQDYYILSTSLQKDNLTLWSQFSGLTGYCLGIDLEKFRQAMTKRYQFIFDGQVIYSHDEQLNILKHIVDETAIEIFSNEKVQSFQDIPDEIDSEQVTELGLFLGVCFQLHALFFKHQSFASEEEYRFIVMGMHNKSVSEKYKNTRFFRTREGLIIPFLKVVSEDNSYLKEIVIGPKNNIDIAHKGIELFCNHLGINASIEKSKIPLRY